VLRPFTVSGSQRFPASATQLLDAGPQIRIRYCQAGGRANFVEPLGDFVADHLPLGHQRGVKVGEIIGFVGRDPLKRLAATGPGLTLNLPEQTGRERGIEPPAFHLWAKSPLRPLW